MYKVNQIVKFKKPMSKVKKVGRILTKFKIIDNFDGCYIDGYCYLIKYSTFEKPILIMENDICLVVRTNINGYKR